MTRHFLKDTDLTPAEQAQVLDLAVELKAAPYSRTPLAGPQTAAVIFDKTSTRTRVSFAAGIAALGGQPLIINPGEAQLGHKESIADTAQVMSRMVSAIVWRTYAQAGLEEMAQNSSVPVINSLSDDYHPCQILADLLTIREHRGDVAGQTMTYYGDGANNMANSYVLGGVNAGMHVRIAAPADYQPAEAIIAEANELAQTTGGSVTVTDDPEGCRPGSRCPRHRHLGVHGTGCAGRDDEASPFVKYQVSSRADDLGNDPIFLHCLPAYRGKEVTRRSHRRTRLGGLR